ncbi:MAG: hypothetical protein LBQ49_02550, partial [Rickettsiales bacterium]|nr:hypothetical protein [Rickettsiales bacterium]
MDKKEILANASEGLKADEMGVLMHIKRHLSAIWARMRGIDRLLCANIALLLLVCAMFFTMFVKIPAKEAPAPQNAPVVRNIKKTDGVGYTLSERTKVLDMTNRAVRKNRPTIVVVSRTSVSASEIKKSAIKKPEVKKPAPATVVETRKVAPKPIV